LTWNTRYIKEKFCQFGEKDLNYVWQPDLHQLTVLAEAAPEGDKTLYTVASIDDRNRFIVLHEIRANKRTDSAAQALTHVLSHPLACLASIMWVNLFQRHLRISSGNSKSDAGRRTEKSQEYD
jgi:hypothetical protein